MSLHVNLQEINMLHIMKRAVVVQRVDQNSLKIWKVRPEMVQPSFGEGREP